MKYATYQFDSLTPGQTQMRNAIAALPLENVQWKVAKDESVSSNLIEDAVDEYRKFLFLIALGNHELAMCSKEVDEVWHSHILFTQEYKDFCQRTFKSFVHHRPGTPTDPVDIEGVHRFRTAYESAYGPLHPIWNAASGARCILKPPPCDGQPPAGCGECGCKCKDEDDDDDDD